MGKRSSHSLMKLGLKRVPPKIWVSEGFAKGHYKFRRLQDNPDGVKTFHRCETRQGSKIWSETEVQPSLEKMGLQRDEKSGKIVPLKKWQVLPHKMFCHSCKEAGRNPNFICDGIYEIYHKGMPSEVKNKLCGVVSSYCVCMECRSDKYNICNVRRSYTPKVKGRIIGEWHFQWITNLLVKDVKMRVNPMNGSVMVLFINPMVV